MTSISTTTRTDVDDIGDIEARATFDLSGEEYPAEPYAWGGSRGTELTMTAELIDLQLGALHIDRDGAVQVLGSATVARMETAEAERMADQYRSFDARMSA